MNVSRWLLAISVERKIARDKILDNARNRQQLFSINLVDSKGYTLAMIIHAKRYNSGSYPVKEMINRVSHKLIQLSEIKRMTVARGV
jgi:hypothetical protein